MNQSFHLTPERIETENVADLRKQDQLHVTSHRGGCNIHGIWFSKVAGVGIELIPEVRDHHIQIRTRMFNVPWLKGSEAVLSTDWVGNGMISPASPTTTTITFQEVLIQRKKVNHETVVRKSSK